MMGAAEDGPSPEILDVIAKLEAGDRLLIQRLWSRPKSRPIEIEDDELRDQARALEALLLILIDVDDETGAEVLGLTPFGRETAEALRKLGDQAPPTAPHKPGLTLLRGELDRAEAEVVQLRPGDGKPPRKRKPEREPGEIYPGCPVTALGVHGKLFFYLDVLGQLHAVDNHTKDRMRALFGGRVDLLMGQWPTRAKGTDEGPGAVIGWKQEDAAAAMQRACAEKGVWSAFEKGRGLGSWPDPDGGVILHCGDAILYRGKWEPPGAHDGFVYPSGPAIPRPLDEAGWVEPASQLLQTLESWRWLRGDLDAYLLLGWIIAAKFGGAIDWRPMAWITGDKGTGKSTLQKLIRLVMGGEGAILQSTDATEASIRQFLMQNTVPVALDELEADVDNRKSLAVVKLARQAASNGVVLRGGADHQGQEFRARSAFLFSSILMPPLLDQDISRLAVLELAPLERGETAPKLEAAEWRKLGRALQTQVLAQWGRLHRTLELYRQALSAAGHDARGCDQFGTLLAMADLALHGDAPTADRCDGWARRLRAEVIGEQVDQSSDWQRCLNHLLGRHLDIYRSGDRFTVYQWIMAAAGLADDPDMLKAQKALPSYGLKIEGRGDTAELVIANNHPMLAKLFEGTHWHAPAGQTGVWVQAIKRIPGAKATEAGIRFNGPKCRAYRIRLSVIPNFGHEPPPAEPAERPAFTGEDFA
jgi:hypothetical protein